MLIISIVCVGVPNVPSCLAKTRECLNVDDDEGLVAGVNQVVVRIITVGYKPNNVCVGVEILVLKKKENYGFYVVV